MKLKLGVLLWHRSEPRGKYRYRRRLKSEVLLIVVAAVGLVLINLVMFFPR